MNLSMLFPISWRATLKHLFPWLLLCLSLVVVSWSERIWAQYFDLDHNTRDLVSYSLLICLGLAFVVTVLKGCYHELYRRSCIYFFDGNQLLIRKGIFLKEQGSFPLSRITDLYLRRSLSDFIFGLCTLHFSTPTEYSGSFARIDGLGQSTATAFQLYLATLLERQMPSNQENLFAVPADGTTYQTIEVPARAQLGYNQSVNF